MPPKRKAAAKKKPPAQKRYEINVKIQIPGEVIEEAQQLATDKECNAHIQRYIFERHDIDIKNLSFAKAPEPSAVSSSTSAKKPKASGVEENNYSAVDEEADNDYF